MLGFVATVPLVVDDAPELMSASRTPSPVVLVTFDEFPVSSLMLADGPLDAARYPNFAPARAGGHVVSARDLGQRDDHAGGAGDPDRRPAPSPRAFPTLADHPDNLFTLLGRRYTLRANDR